MRIAHTCILPSLNASMFSCSFTFLILISKFIGVQRSMFNTPQIMIIVDSVEGCRCPKTSMHFDTIITIGVSLDVSRILMPVHPRCPLAQSPLENQFRFAEIWFLIWCFFFSYINGLEWSAFELAFYRIVG